MFTAALAPGARQALEVLKDKRAVCPFYLAGGTALAMQLGHRISVDLDFFTERSFDPAQLLAALATESAVLSSPRLSQGTLAGVLCGANVSFMEFPHSMLEPFVKYGAIDVASPRDIAMMKLHAIASRGAKRDFVDLYFILQAMPQLDLLGDLTRKFSIHAPDDYHYVRSLVFFQDADRQPDPDMLKPFTWADVKAYIRQFVKRNFHP